MIVMLRRHGRQQLPRLPVSNHVEAGPDWIHESNTTGIDSWYIRRPIVCACSPATAMPGRARFPWIVEAARKIRQTRFVLDGEAVVLGVDGVSDLNALHSRKHDDEVQFCTSWSTAATTSGSCR